MSDPLFILTSVGYINFSLVAHIDIRGECLRFVFNGSQSTGEENMDPYCLELDIKEGQDVVTKAIHERPEWFVST